MANARADESKLSRTERHDPRSLDLERENLTAFCGLGFFSSDLNRTGLLPGSGHHSAGPADFLDLIEDCLDQSLFVDLSQLRAGEEIEVADTVFIFRFDGLVIERTTAEPGRQDFFHDPRQVSGKEGHAFAGQFLVAADVAEVRGKAQGIEFTATGSGLQRPVVTVFHVDEDLAGRR